MGATISQYFSNPKSDPKPASVTTISPSFRATFVARTLLHPCAILPNGPPCTSAGVPSSVCTRLGFSASFNIAAIAPCAFTSAAVTGVPSRRRPTSICPSRSFNSISEFDRQRIAITSDATVIA